ncbi:hypothetical protein ACSTIC_23425, partial [Vibrio parahaemolyticus]
FAERRIDITNGRDPVDHARVDAWPIAHESAPIRLFRVIKGEIGVLPNGVGVTVAGRKNRAADRCPGRYRMAVAENRLDKAVLYPLG